MPQGAANAARQIAFVESPEGGLPSDAIATLKVLVSSLTQLEKEISKLDAEIARRAKENEVARRRPARAAGATPAPGGVGPEPAHSDGTARGAERPGRAAAGRPWPGSIAPVWWSRWRVT